MIPFSIGAALEAGGSFLTTDVVLAGLGEPALVGEHHRLSAVAEP